MSEHKDFITKTVKDNSVVVFMKGTVDFPMCGFSGRAVQVLKASGAEKICGVNCLEDADLRNAVKEFSDWPTLPQIYIKGEFIGGGDIVSEMGQSGELSKLLAK